MTEGKLPVVKWWIQSGDKPWKDVWFVAASAGGCPEGVDIANCHCSYISLVSRNWFATWLWGWGEKKWGPSVWGEWGESTGFVYPLADTRFMQCEAQVTSRYWELKGSRYWPPAEKGSLTLSHTVNKALNREILSMKRNQYENNKDEHCASVRVCVKQHPIAKGSLGQWELLSLFCINLMT